MGERSAHPSNDRLAASDEARQPARTEARRLLRREAMQRRITELDRPAGIAIAGKAVVTFHFELE